MDDQVFVFTFGAGQYHGLLANHVVEIQAPNQDIARECMHSAFGNKWSMCYTREDFDKNYSFPVVRLGLMDRYGNILSRG